MVTTRAQAAISTHDLPHPSTVHELPPDIQQASVTRKRQKPSTSPAYTFTTTVTSTPHQSQRQGHQKDSSQLPSAPPLLSLPPAHPAALTIPDRQANHYGLIQERLLHLHTTHLISSTILTYALLLQAILWNQTTGRTALPVLRTLLTLYPTPESLAKAPLEVLTQILRPIGLYNIRAKRLVEFARVWMERPPAVGRRYVRRDYPNKGDGRKGGEIETCGWEVAHLPGVGPYALDSWRIFGRDALLGRGLSDAEYYFVEDDGKAERVVQGSAEAAEEATTGKEMIEEAGEEWRRVVPGDKDLRAWLIWRWSKEGWTYDILTGKRKRIGEDVEHEDDDYEE